MATTFINRYNEGQSLYGFGKRLGQTLRTLAPLFVKSQSSVGLKAPTLVNFMIQLAQSYFSEVHQMKSITFLQQANHPLNIHNQFSFLPLNYDINPIHFNVYTPQMGPLSFHYINGQLLFSMVFFLPLSNCNHCNLDTVSS